MMIYYSSLPMTWDTQRLGTVGDFQNCEKPNDLGHGTPGGTRAGSPDPRLGTLGGAGAGTPAPRQDGSDLHEPQAQRQCLYRTDQICMSPRLKP